MDATQTAAILAAVGFLGIAGFQLALALGAPLGHAAWGGAHRVLPHRLRLASAIAAVVWVTGALIVLGRAGSNVYFAPPRSSNAGGPGCSSACWRWER